jgi:O-antigen/teichoic acid export membrane protein
MDKIKNLVIGLKNISIIGSANAIAALISGAFWFYVAALLGTEQFGKVNYIVAIATIAYSISYLGSGNTVIVYTAKEKKIQTSVYLIAIISSSVAAIILFFIFYNVGASLFVVGGVIFGLAISELLGRKLYKDFVKYVLTQRVLLVVLAIPLYYLVGPDGVILGFALSCFPYVVRLCKGFRDSKIDFSVIKSRSGFMINSYSKLIKKFIF